jgi:nucleotide-binding universal stress UspA family protein
MGSSFPFLANTTADIADFAEDARNKADGRIVLVAVDFSQPSAAALVHAAKMADWIPAALIVLHIVHDPGDMPGYYSKLVKKKHLDRIPDTAAEVFAEFVTDVASANPELSLLEDVDKLMVVGLPVSRILEVVNELGPVMVVMGSQGRTGLESLMVGSKAAQIIQLCPVPVTIVKGEVEDVDD